MPTVAGLDSRLRQSVELRSAHRHRDRRARRTRSSATSGRTWTTSPTASATASCSPRRIPTTSPAAVRRARCRAARRTCSHGSDAVDGARFRAYASHPGPGRPPLGEAAWLEALGYTSHRVVGQPRSCAPPRGHPRPPAPRRRRAASGDRGADPADRRGAHGGVPRRVGLLRAVGGRGRWS